MWRRRPARAASLILASLICASCARRYGAVVLPSSGPKTTSPAVRAQAMRRELTHSRDRVRELEQQLAARDREIATVRSQIDNARSGTPRADEASGPGSGSAAPAAEVPAVEAAAEPPAPPPARQPEPAPVPPEAVASAQAATQAPDARLISAERQIARLEDQLTVEVKRREEVEAEMARLLQETSAGPYERGTGAVVEKHLREELAGARREIADLRTSLVTERRERQELEKRFSTLQIQVQKAAAAGQGGNSEEIEALKQRQRRVLASIQQDLQASQQREGELRTALEQAQGTDAVSLADAVAGLRSENSALQMRLDQEHRQNRDLSSKLQLATRVTDLIFKMQTGGAQPAAARVDVE